MTTLGNWSVRQKARNYEIGFITACLRFCARAACRNRRGAIVAVTGSAGKTTTKNCVAAVLQSHFRVRRSLKNRNDHLGVPTTLLCIDRVRSLRELAAALPAILKRMVLGPPREDYLVLEVGAGLPNLIARQLRLFQPKISVVTNIGPAHLEVLGGIEGVAREKSQIVSALPPDGYAILCHDDETVRKMAALTRAKSLSYGFSPEADVWMDEPRRADQGDGLAAMLHDRDGAVALTFPKLSNRYHLYAVMAAWCVGVATGVPRDKLAAAVQGVTPVEGRGRVMPGPAGSLLYDDSYNANPLSMRAALETFSDLAHGRRRVLVLGDMLELGDEEDYWHSAIGKKAAAHGEVLIAVGRAARKYLEAFREARPSARAFLCTNSDEALQRLAEELLPGDAVMIKGSHGVHLGKLATRIAESPGEPKRVVPPRRIDPVS